MYALYRGDEVEANCLYESCPKKKYLCRDIEYTLRMQCITIIGSAFFERCILLYNQIEGIDRYFNEFMDEVSSRNPVAEKIKHSVEKLIKAKDRVTAQIKAFYAGFAEFCLEVGPNSEHIINTLPIEDCCHSINSILSSQMGIDETYKNKIKEYFGELWQF